MQGRDTMPTTHSTTPLRSTARWALAAASLVLFAASGRAHAPATEVEPHKYTDGPYLVLHPAAAAGSAYRIVFETDGRRVTRHRAGTRPQVEYVEGCA
jgi:hypothetical protein